MSYPGTVSFDVRVTVPAEELPGVVKALDSLFDGEPDWSYTVLDGTSYPHPDEE